MDVNLDEAVRAAYVAQDRSMDDILCHPDVASEFGASVRSALPRSVDLPNVLRRLMALRKRGAAKGGLPRKPR